MRKGHRRTTWSDTKCERLLATHWDDTTATLDIAAITTSLGGQNAAADFFADVLRSDLLGWRAYAAGALRRIVAKHLDPETQWLGALWEHSKASVSTDPDEMIELLKLIRMASSDRVRQWMAGRLLSLCSTGTDAQRVFAFQGLESLIKAGGLVYVKRFAKQLEQMANAEEDHRFQLAAEGIRAFLYPQPARAVQSPIAPVSKAPDASESRLLTAVNTLLDQEAFCGVDMIAAELLPSAVLVSESGDRRPPVRVLAGKLADLFPEDPYPPEPYPFLTVWKEIMPLRVQIFGPDGDSSTQKKPATFVTTLTDIQDVARMVHEAASSDLDITARLLLQKPSTEDTGGIETAVVEAAKAVLLSTKYTAALMSSSTFKNRSERLDHLPHTDQRNLVFLTCLQEGRCVGGMAIFSHYPLSNNVTALAEVMLMRVAYEITSVRLLNREAQNGNIRVPGTAVTKFGGAV